jgi:hypothetical protein
MAGAAARTGDHCSTLIDGQNDETRHAERETWGILPKWMTCSFPQKLRRSTYFKIG